MEGKKLRCNSTNNAKMTNLKARFLAEVKRQQSIDEVVLNGNFITIIALNPINNVQVMNTYIMKETYTRK